MIENRKSFFARISYFAPSDRFFVRKGYDLMKATHRDQYRKQIVDGKRERYAEHPRRVAIIVHDELHITEPIALVLALGHDVLEDAHKNADVTPEYVEYYFQPEDGAEIVQQLLLLTTEEPLPDGSDKVRKKAMYLVRRRRYATIITLIVKGCDRLDNLRSLCCEGTTIEFIEKQCKETRTDYIPLFEYMEEKARGTKYHDAALKLLGMLREQLTRCETELARMRAAPPPAPTVASIDPMAPSDTEDDAVCADHD
jgi:(p)ppGpp synthase/HD superfamily hydrolase